MTHIRQQLRAAFKTELTGITGVKKIFHARPHAPGKAEMPAIQIITPGEAIEPLDQSDVETRRRVDVDVFIYLLADEGGDDEIDAIAAQIETRILTATGEPWDTLIMHFPTSAEFTVGEAAEETLMVLRTRFRVDLQASTPETIGD